MMTHYKTTLSRMTIIKKINFHANNISKLTNDNGKHSLWGSPWIIILYFHKFCDLTKIRRMTKLWALFYHFWPKSSWLHICRRFFRFLGKIHPRYFRTFPVCRLHCPNFQYFINYLTQFSKAARFQWMSDVPLSYHFPSFH
jgi:hypothetical protein